MVVQDSVGIARALHDGIAQDLVALGYSVDLLIAVPQTPTEIRIELRKMRFRVDELITKVRQEIFHLRQNGSSRLSADTSLQLASIAQDICGERLGQVRLATVALTFEVHQVVMSAAAELLRNSYTHSRATQIDLTLSSIENRICLVVEDNGVGGAHMSSTRFGLRGISEQVAVLNGEFTFESNSKGTQVQILL